MLLSLNSKLFFLVLALLAWAWWLGPPPEVLANPAERRLTILAGLPEIATGWSGFLTQLPQWLGPRLNSQPRLTYNPTAKGVIAANRLSMAPLDGELLGVLPMTALITRVIEERTPYLLTDFDPVVLTPGDTYVLLASREAKFDRLNQVNPKNLTLYHNGLDPISPGALLALAVMKSQGGFPNLVETEVLTPDILAHDPNATLAWSLHQLDAAAPAKGYKIVAVLTENYSGPCAPPKMDLQSQGLKTQVHNYLGFYYPHRTIQAEKETLAQALVATLDDPQAKELAQKMCLAKTNQDSLSLPPNQAVRLLGLELAAQTGLMESLKADHE